MGYFQSLSKLDATATQIGEARQVSTRLLRDPSAGLDAILTAARFFELNSDVVETIALLDRANRRNPKDASIANRLAYALEKAGEYDRAGELLKRALAEIENSAEGRQLQEAH
jgi:tetratricopeptide (TPR) repeat protein